VIEEGDHVTFLYAVEEGGADRSYGIEVAKLAGIPGTVIEKAQEILKGLESATIGEESLLSGENTEPQQAYLPLSVQVETHPVVKKLEELDVNNMTPMEAMKTLDELKRAVSRKP